MTITNAKKQKKERGNKKEKKRVRTCFTRFYVRTWHCTGVGARRASTAIVAGLQVVQGRITVVCMPVVCMPYTQVAALSAIEQGVY